MHFTCTFLSQYINFTICIHYHFTAVRLANVVKMVGRLQTSVHAKGLIKRKLVLLSQLNLEVNEIKVAC
jgi:hypothetical protein